MKLSMWMIARHLEKYVIRIEITVGDPNINGVRFFSGENNNFLKEYVYIGAASDIFSDSIYTDKLLLVNEFDMIFIDSQDIETILNELFSAFDYYNNWESRLWEASASKDPMQKIVDVSSDIIPNPLRFAGLEGNIVAISKKYGPDDVDERWKTLHETGFIPPRVGGVVIKADGAAQHGWTSKPQEYIFTTNNKKYIASTIVVNGEAVASLMIWEYDKPFSPCICQLSEILCNVFVSIIENHNDQSSIRTSAAIVTDVLDGRTIENDILIHLSKKIEHPYQLLLIENSSGITELIVKGRVLHFIQNSYKDGISLIYKDGIIILISATKTEDFFSNFDKIMHELYIAGVSLPFSDLSSLSIRYKQASYAIEMGKNTPGVYYSKDYAFNYLIDSIIANNQSMEFTHPALNTLREHDQTQKSELYNTLYQFLANERNLVSTAESLFIHRNTLVFRIKKISSIISVDFEDPLERAYIFLSYLIDKKVHTKH